jgi:hypothetical protein
MLLELGEQTLGAVAAPLGVVRRTREGAALGSGDVDCVEGEEGALDDADFERRDGAEGDDDGAGARRG